MPNEKYSILVLEDQEDLNELMCADLNAAGHKVYSATTIKQARGIALTKKIDVMISDLKLPDGNAKYLLNDLKAQNIKFAKTIIISGDLGHLKKERQDEKTFLLEKPFTTTDLIAKIKSGTKVINSQDFLSEDIEISIEGLDSRFEIMEIEEEDLCFFSLDQKQTVPPDPMIHLKLMFGEDSHYFTLNTKLKETSGNENDGFIYFVTVNEESKKVWQHFFEKRSNRQDEINNFLKNAKGF